MICSCAHAKTNLVDVESLLGVADELEIFLYGWIDVRMRNS